MDVVVENIQSDLYLVHHLFSEERCRQLIEMAEGIGFQEATVRTSSGPKMLKHIRNNDRVDVDDPVLSGEMWEKVLPFLNPMDGQHPVGVDSHLRFYRYFPGQIFKRHKDGSVTNQEGQKSKLTYLVYLNDDYEGGQTVFREYSGDGEDRRKELTTISPQTGSVLIFRHEKWHESVPLTSGSKYVLRTDIFYS